MLIHFYYKIIPDSLLNNIGTKKQKLEKLYFQHAMYVNLDIPPYITICLEHLIFTEHYLYMNTQRRHTVVIVVRL